MRASTNVMPGFTKARRARSSTKICAHPLSWFGPTMKVFDLPILRSKSFSSRNTYSKPCVTERQTLGKVSRLLPSVWISSPRLLVKTHGKWKSGASSMNSAHCSAALTARAFPRWRFGLCWMPSTGAKQHHRGGAINWRMPNLAGGILQERTAPAGLICRDLISPVLC